MESELDKLVLSSGKEADKINAISTDGLIEQYEKKFNSSTILAYEDGTILPGSKVDMPSARDVEMTKEEAETHAMAQVALNKLDNENKEFEKLSDDAKIKDYIIKQYYYRETNNYFHKYHYEMSGSQKHTLKRQLERMWKNGKFKLTQSQKDDILFELNKASRQPINEQAPTQNTTNNTSQYINDLNSLIFKS